MYKRQAPYGYVLDDTPVYFDITEENSTEEGGVTVVKVNKPNIDVYKRQCVSNEE